MVTLTHLQLFIGIISSSFFTTIITLFATKRKQKTEIESLEIDIQEKNLRFWKDMNSELLLQVERMQSEILVLRTAVERLENENSLLTKKMKK